MDFCSDTSVQLETYLVFVRQMKYLTLKESVTLFSATNIP